MQAGYIDYQYKAPLTKPLNEVRSGGIFLIITISSSSHLSPGGGVYLFPVSFIWFKTCRPRIILEEEGSMGQAISNIEFSISNS
jgi:hypothetical protein